MKVIGKKGRQNPIFQIGFDDLTLLVLRFTTWLLFLTPFEKIDKIFIEQSDWLTAKKTSKVVVFKYSNKTRCRSMKRSGRSGKSGSSGVFGSKVN